MKKNYRYSISFLLILLISLLFSCHNPIENNGSIKYYLNRINPELTKGNNSKAYLKISKCEFTLKDSNGSIAEEWEVELSEEFPNTYSGEISTLPLLNNASLEVKVFNYSVSESTPVLEGIESSINITPETQDITLTCFPITQTELEDRNVSSDFTLEQEGEKWFKFKADTDLSLINIENVVGNSKFIVFDENGKHIKTSTSSTMELETIINKIYYIGVFAETNLEFNIKYSIYIPNWTIMVYLDGDNNLEAAGLLDMIEMEKGLYEAYSINPEIIKELNIIVLVDRCEEHYNGVIHEDDISGWDGTRIYKMTKDNQSDKIVSERLFDARFLNEENMGDPNTLTKFINFCSEKYPSDRTMLVLWNHGGGAKSNSIDPKDFEHAEKQICSDDESGDSLYLGEISKAIEDSNLGKVDILGMDACLMGTIEVAYQLKNATTDVADYLVGSMHTEQGNGWSYDYIIKAIANGNASDSNSALPMNFTPLNPTPEELSKIIVYAYENFIENSNSNNNAGETQAAYDLSQITSLKLAIDELAKQISIADIKDDIETIRDNSVHYYDDAEVTLAEGETNIYSIQSSDIHVPYIDLYDFAYRIANETLGNLYSEDLKNAANSVITAMESVIILTYGDEGSFGNYADGTQYFFGTGTSEKKGFTIFFPKGDNLFKYNDSNYPYLLLQTWYTEKDLSSEQEDYGHYGNIKFANFDDNGVVETWCELIQYYYDPDDNYDSNSTY